MAKKGVLLLNIGSPQSYKVDDVKAYLKNFLMDKDVINLPFIFRWPLVNLLIVPKRGPFSAANYQKVWMEGEGSPLTVYTNRFAKKLQMQLGQDYTVKIGMRYAEPTIDRALTEFKDEGVTDVLLAPMFPQYAEATTGSSVKFTLNEIERRNLGIKTATLPSFYNEDAFIQPSVDIAKATIQNKKVDHYLFSFHGLPESHIRKICDCLDQDNFSAENHSANCYRGQCIATATTMAQRLGISDLNWSISFQSRLGRAEWLKPSTDDTLKTLPKTGKKNIAVLCPSFVADCIET
jgi:ferrochelatase